MSRLRNSNKDVPKWVTGLTDEEVVERFKWRVDRQTFTYESIGRDVVDMRKRLMRILVDGLAAKQKERSMAHLDLSGERNEVHDDNAMRSVSVSG